MMNFPIYGKIKNVPNPQPVYIYMVILGGYLDIFQFKKTIVIYKKRLKYISKWPSMAMDRWFARFIQ